MMSKQRVRISLGRRAIGVQVIERVLLSVPNLVSLSHTVKKGQRSRVSPFELVNFICLKC